MPLHLRKFQIPALTVSLLAGVLISSYVLAQSESEPSPAQNGPILVKNVTNQEIDQVAAIVIELRRITEAYSEKTNRAKNKAQVHQMRQRMQKEIEQAIEEQGLSVTRYRRIISAAQHGSELHRRIVQSLQKQEVK